MVTRIANQWADRIYDAEPDVFPSPETTAPSARPIPSTIPSFTAPFSEDKTRRTGIYDTLDSNVGSDVMEFTHTPLPRINSALSTKRFGPNNPTRPFRTVAGYLEDLFTPFLHLVTLNTTLEKLEKSDGQWTLTLRQSEKEYRGQTSDYWWTEEFDAVIVASGHYTVPQIPTITGLTDFAKVYPSKLEHSKSFRNSNDYVGKVLESFGSCKQCLTLNSVL